MIDELTSYLDQEADRVHVLDTLADIESRYARVPLTAARRGSRWFAPALVGAAAAIVVLIGVASAGSDTRSDPAGAALGTAPIEPAAEQPDSSPATVAALVPIPLPDGATMQGFAPMCTTRDGIEFECAVEGYRNAGGYDDGGFDHTGESQLAVSAASIVTGGCVSTSADGSTWHCVLGDRAVELGFLLPITLGQPGVIGYAAG